MTDTMLTFRTPAERARDAEGVYRDGATVTREVYARVESVSGGEFFAAGQKGFKPEFRFVVFPDEYRGEDECEYEGEAYAIYRTFLRKDTDELELYVHREKGVHNGA